MQKNLEQIRASHALNFWNEIKNKKNDEEVGGKQGGDVVRGLASLIINNGLLATIAFSKEKGKGYETFMKEIGKFLSCEERKILSEKVDSLDDFIKILTEGDSYLLQCATNEAIAYLAYLKRFRIKKEEEHASSNA